MAEDRREIAPAFTGAVAVFHHQKTRGRGGDAWAEQAIDQAQSQFRPGHQPRRGDQVTVVDNRRVGLQFDLRVTLGKRLGRGPVGGGAATVEQAAFGEHQRAHTNTTKGCAARMLIAQPLRKTRGHLRRIEPAEGRRNQHGEQSVFGTGMTVVNPRRQLLAHDLPVTDPQQGQLHSLILGGNAVGHGEQVGQTVHRRQLRAGVNQHAQFSGGGSLCSHCQFSPVYCRCGQSSNPRPASILRPHPITVSRTIPWPSKRSS